jgi:hypothetical protein
MMKKFFGLILFVLVGAALVISGAYLRFRRRVLGGTRRLFATARPSSQKVVTAEMLQGLPEPVQRYLTYTEVVGKPWVDTVRIRQAGKFRPRRDGPWMDMTAEQYYTTNPPGFVWDATLYLGGLPLLRIRDRYFQGQGHMFAKLAAIIPIFDERGEKLTQGTMQRYLSEIIWCPAAFLNDYITWRAIDNHSAEATFTDHGRSVSAIFYFDDQGRFTNLKAERYNQADDRLQTWMTPVDEFGEIAGLKLGTRGRALWVQEEGEYSYIDVTLEEVEYNHPAPFG